MSRAIVCAFITSVLSILLAFPSFSHTPYVPVCGKPHSKLPMKTHAQQFVEDLSAPRDQRIKAMKCLIFYGRRGVPILSRVLERESDNFDSMVNALGALRWIQDRSVMEPMLRLLGDESRGSDQSRVDWNSTASRKIKPSYKELAVEILTKLAFTSLEEPNVPSKRGWVGQLNTHERRSRFEGERLGRYEVNRITAVLKKIAESDIEDATEAEKRFFRAAAEGLARIEKRIALLRKSGPYKIYSIGYFDRIDTLDFHCPPTVWNRLTFCYREGEGSIADPSFAQIGIKFSNNILPFSLPQFSEPPSDARPYCRNPFHNPEALHRDLLRLRQLIH